MKIFVGCSSSNDIPKNYIDDCKEYLTKLLLNNDLVFGGDSHGIMGISYDVAVKNNNEVIGITPKIFEKELRTLKCTKSILTNYINERTNLLIENSDAIVFLPGGIGTIYELFTVLEFKRSKEFDKPVIIYNSCNYFDKLFEFLEQVYNEKFANDNIKSCYHVSNDIEDTLEYLKNYNKVR